MQYNETPVRRGFAFLGNKMDKTPAHNRIRRNALMWMLLASVLTASIYWPGLSGPFIFDDAQNIRLLQSWRTGQIGLWDFVGDNGGVLFNRSLAMGSLALNLVIGGESSFSFKLGNLLMHLACGWLAFAVFAKLLKRDPNLRSFGTAMAACIAITWLCHPFNASTVLYVIQRMSQIATLFCLLGVLLYAITRDRMLSGALGEKQSFIRLVFGIGLLTFLGILGKQTAVILPGLCLVVELGWYQKLRDWPRSLRWFYVLSVVLPAITIILVVAWQWPWLQGHMLEWGMTVGQRLMSEPRALCSYLLQLLVPYAPSMGIYTDDFAVSRTLLDPPTTVPAMLTLAFLSVAAWRLRGSRPAIFVGWFWFLVAHSVEASIVPIELYYEHRNYLPSFGIILLVFDAVAAGFAWLESKNLHMWKYSVVLTACLLAGLGMQTLTIALQWRSLLGIALAGIESHPNSARVYIDYGRAAIDAKQWGQAYSVFSRMAENKDPAISSIGKVEVTLLNCYFRGDSDPLLLDEAVRESPPRLNYIVQYAVGDLVGMRARRGCNRITPLLLGDSITQMVDKASVQSESSQSKWTLRYNAAMAYYQAGAWQQALAQARIAWNHGPDPTVALLYVRLLLKDADLATARQVFWQVMKRAGYSKSEQLDSGTRTAALKAIREEINAYASRHGQPGVDTTDLRASPDRPAVTSP